MVAIKVILFENLMYGGLQSQVESGKLQVETLNMDDLVETFNKVIAKECSGVTGMKPPPSYGHLPASGRRNAVR